MTSFDEPPRLAAPVALRRVALVIGQLGVGGTERQLVLLAEGLRDRGVEVRVASLFGEGVYARHLRDLGFDVHTGSVVSRGNEDDFPSLSRSVPAIARHTVTTLPVFVGWLRKFRPQVLHAFLYHAYVASAFAGRLARVDQIVAGRRSLGFYKDGRRFALLVERGATRLTDHVVANAQAVAHEAAQVERLAPEKLSVIPNGLDARAFASCEPCPVATDRPVVVCVANLLAVKGHTYLLQAAAQLTSSAVAPTLVLVGDGPEREPLTRLAAQLDVDVRFLGRHTDTRPMLAAADVVVLPSTSEGMSNAVLEAMAAGKPVVCTDVGGNREAIGDAGVLVPPGNVDDLACAVASVLRDPERARKLGHDALERARERFSQEAMVERHIGLYERLLVKRSPR